MLDKTIDNALLNLRKNTIRSDGAGLDHVEALLELRGVHMPRVMRAKKPDAARRGLMAHWVMQALQDGPKRMGEVAAYVAERRPEIDRATAYQRSSQCLARLKLKGLVTREGRLWRLI